MKKILILVLILVGTTSIVNANPTKLRSYSIGVKRYHTLLTQSDNAQKATHYYTHHN
ncbi:hypothetical protein [Francisella philomiragia]|uniref:hypothetical protein n=1 Tax=Francisella philomiragia TaxID=28110 RepID=UPI001908A0FB|nr:hypothetical protein [Francisella philomiragia]MBK2297361.1 hypothetical protein [Francisella philomiragia]MBK2340692.1 hypothetical protein [Francisella philomiragia]